MYRSLIFNGKDEIISIGDYPSFEETLKSLHTELDVHKHVTLSGAYIYKYLNPGENQSMQMIASLRVIR